jgi:hypothetical protein
MFNHQGGKAMRARVEYNARFDMKETRFFRSMYSFGECPMCEKNGLLRRVKVDNGEIIPLCLHCRVNRNAFEISEFIMKKRGIKCCQR